MLEDYRIGNLNEVDVAENEAMEEDDPWVNEPRRHPALRLIHILNIENQKGKVCWKVRKEEVAKEIKNLFLKQWIFRQLLK